MGAGDFGPDLGEVGCAEGADSQEDPIDSGSEAGEDVVRLAGGEWVEGAEDTDFDQQVFEFVGADGLETAVFAGGLDGMEAERSVEGKARGEVTDASSEFSVGGEGDEAPKGQCGDGGPGGGIGFREAVSGEGGGEGLAGERKQEAAFVEG